MNKSQNIKIRYLKIPIGGFIIAFMFSLHLVPYPLSYLVKATPIFLLSLLTLVGIKNKKGRLLALGLFFSGIGDVVLGLPAKGTFVFGIVAFTIAHLFYISIFFRNVIFSKIRVLILLILLIYASIIVKTLTPNLDTMLIPVLIYLGIILVMAGGATLGKNNHYLVTIGALLFVVSDSLIAINGFVLPLLYSDHWIMSTYYLAQILIVRGSFISYKNQ